MVWTSGIPIEFADVEVVTIVSVQVDKIAVIKFGVVVDGHWCNVVTGAKVDSGVEYEDTRVSGGRWF